MRMVRRKFQRTKYIVGALARGTTKNPDGTLALDRVCGHTHRSMSTARQCCVKLLHNILFYGQFYQSLWYVWEVYHADRTPLTDDEIEELESLD